MSKTHEGISYYFAYWKHDEAKWNLALKRFLLTHSEDIAMLRGQFITSMWLKYLIDQEKPMHYIVFGVKDVGKRHQIIDEINRDHLTNNGIPSVDDLPYTAEFCEYFVGSKEITEKINDETKDNIHTTYNFAGTRNNINQLTMNYECFEGELCATLPEFIIEC